jgi:hypothetical protein
VLGEAVAVEEKALLIETWAIGLLIQKLFIHVSLDASGCGGDSRASYSLF